jgi:biotin operon repressor
VSDINLGFREKEAIAFLAKHPGLNPAAIHKQFAEQASISFAGAKNIFMAVRKKGFAIKRDGLIYPKDEAQAELPLSNGHDKPASAGTRLATGLRQSQILELLKTHPEGMSARQLTDAMGVSKQSVHTAIHNLGAQVASERLSGRGHPFGYRLRNGEAPTSATEPTAPIKRRRKKREMLLATMTLREFERFCEAAEMELEQGLALAYRLILKQFTSNFRGE